MVENVTAERARAIVTRLERMAATDEPRPIAAITLAEMLDIRGNRENKRRRVREAVEHARTDETIAARICADRDGYWLARNGSEWAEFLAATRAKTVFRFVQISRAARAVWERVGGQWKLFD